MCAAAHRYSFRLPPLVRVTVEVELLEPCVGRALLVGDVQSGIRIQIPPSVLSSRAAVHQAEGATGLENLRYLVEGVERDVVHGASGVDDARSEVEAAKVTGRERIGDHRRVRRFVPILYVATHEDTTTERPRVAVRVGLAGLAQVGRPPDIELDGLLVRWSLLDDELRLVPRKLRVCDIGDQDPALALNEPFPGESFHQFRRDQPQLDLGQLVHLFVQQ